MFDRSLQKYDIDTTACTQRIICWYVKDSAINVAENSATTVNKIINGITSASWALEYTDGTAINDAIAVGKALKNCERTYPSCRMDRNFIANTLMQLRTKT